MAKNLLQLTGKIDPKSFKKFRKRFGDSSNEALLRAGVFAAREAAMMTRPPGKSRKQITGAIEAGALAVCSPVKPGVFAKIVKTGKIRRGRGGRFIKIPSSQILAGVTQIEKWIESHRGEEGRTKDLPLEKKGACKTTDYRKALAARKRTAGRVKGAWLGAGIEVSRKGGGRIGKSFMGWAQKHSEEGAMRYRPRILGKSSLILLNRVPYSPALFSRSAGREAGRKAWKKTLAWYKKAVRKATK